MNALPGVSKAALLSEFFSTRCALRCRCSAPHSAACGRACRQPQRESAFHSSSSLRRSGPHRTTFQRPNTSQTMKTLPSTAVSTDEIRESRDEGYKNQNPHCPRLTNLQVLQGAVLASTCLHGEPERRASKAKHGRRLFRFAVILCLLLSWPANGLAESHQADTGSLPAPRQGGRAKSAKQTGNCWIESFTGLPPGQSPEGYRYDINVYGPDIEVIFQYDYIGEVDFQISVNGGLFNSGFSCYWDDNTNNPGHCFVTLPYNCGKVTFQVKQTFLCPGCDVYSEPIDIYVFNGPGCLPQCDSCQLTSSGQGAGEPINIATGKLWYQRTDMALSGPDSLRFSRWYDNQSTYSKDRASVGGTATAPIWI